MRILALIIGIGIIGVISYFLFLYLCNFDRDEALKATYFTVIASVNICFIMIIVLYELIYIF